jgi:hypothetical protein
VRQLVVSQIRPVSRRSPVYPAARVGTPADPRGSSALPGAHRVSGEGLRTTTLVSSRLRGSSALPGAHRVSGEGLRTTTLVSSRLRLNPVGRGDICAAGMGMGAMDAMGMGMGNMGDSWRAATYHAEAAAGGTRATADSVVRAASRPTLGTTLSVVERPLLQADCCLGVNRDTITVGIRRRWCVL